jgi:hypothetical protein
VSSKMITRGPVPALELDDPTGLPEWPMLCLAGCEGSGKSYLSAKASASDLIGRTFYVAVGETGIDEYGAIPGARFQKVRHDGTFMGIARQVWAATSQPRVDGKPNLIVIDSATELWDLVSAEQQEAVNAKAARNGRGKPGEDTEMKFDDWNSAKKRWRALLDLLKEHDGPVILTARLEEVSDAKAILAGNKFAPPIWKVRAEKNLPFDVSAMFHAYKPLVWHCTKIRSLRITVEPGEALQMPREFDIDWILRKLGLQDGGTRRAYQQLDAEAYLDEQAREVAETYAADQARNGQARQQATAGQQQEDPRLTAQQWLAKIDECGDVDCARSLWTRANAAGQLLMDIDGMDLQDRIRARVEKLTNPGPAQGKPADRPSAGQERPAGPAGGADQAPAVREAHSGPEPVEGEVLPARPRPDDDIRASRMRDGMISSLVELYGGGESGREAMEAACEQKFGKPLVMCGTVRLRNWIKAELAEQVGDKGGEAA